eukprot:5723478-Alexandrium_andersonii.AAC.1
MLCFPKGRLRRIAALAGLGIADCTLGTSRCKDPSLRKTPFRIYCGPFTWLAGLARRSGLRAI